MCDGQLQHRCAEVLQELRSVYASFRVNLVQMRNMLARQPEQAHRRRVVHAQQL
jgi:hypothetical protein